MTQRLWTDPEYPWINSSQSWFHTSDNVILLRSGLGNLLLFFLEFLCKESVPYLEHSESTGSRLAWALEGPHFTAAHLSPYRTDRETELVGSIVTHPNVLNSSKRSPHYIGCSNTSCLLVFDHDQAALVKLASKACTEARKFPCSCMVRILRRDKKFV